MNYWECQQIFKEMARDMAKFRKDKNRYQGNGRVGRSPDGRRATKARRKGRRK